MNSHAPSVAAGEPALPGHWATEVDPFTTDIGLVFLEVDPEALRLLEEFGERISV